MKWLYRLCKRYVRRIDGYSYNPDRNGEHWLVDRLSGDDVTVVFDVGANLGRWTAAALEAFPEASVHAFELSASTYEQLAAGAGRNPRCKPNPFGLSDEEGSVEYKDYGEGSGKNTLLTEADFHDSRTPPTRLAGRVSTGERYCAEQGITHVDVLKIDVEGAEHLVLAGFESLLARQAVGLIQFEYGYTHGDARFLMRDFYALFSRHGYVVGPLRHGGVQFCKWNYKLNGFESGPNFVAVRANDAALIERVGSA